MDTNKDFINVVEKDLEPNTEYLRYWHGSMLILRPLLVIFTMSKIYLINKILIYLLLLILTIVMFKRSKKLVIGFVISLILTAIWYVPKCIEYSVTFYIYIIVTLIALKLDKKETDIDKVNRNLFRLFLITGICTTFFDFLTTEILTLFIPIIVIILVRYEEKRMNSIKEILLFIFKAGFLWSMGYTLTWLAKWLIASIVLKINAMDYIKENLLFRIRGSKLEKSGIGLYKSALNKNITAIPIMTYISIKFYKWQVKLAIGVFIAFILMFIKWKGLKNKKYLIPMLLIAMTPYCRYLVLAQHSRNHAMFTFRSQIITIMILIYIIIDNWNKYLMFKDVPVFKKKTEKQEIV